MFRKLKTNKIHVHVLYMYQSLTQILATPISFQQFHAENEPNTTANRETSSKVDMKL
jgi:hypothetical protein